MSGWPFAKLGNVCEVLDSLRRPITKRDRLAGPIPYYGASGVLDHVEGKLFDEPLVLLGEDGAKWEAGANSAFAISGPSWVNNHAHVLRPRREQLDDAWLVHFLNFADLLPFVTGLTVPKLNQEMMRSIPIPLPPLAEQQHIVAILDEALEGIEVAMRGAEKAIGYADELFGSGAVRLLGTAGNDWVDTTLGDLCQIARGGSPRPIQAFLTEAHDGINWIKIGDATASGKVIYATRQRIKPEGASRSRKVFAGDLLLSNSMSFGRPYILGIDGCIHDGWLVLSAEPEKYDSSYLYHLLGSTLAFDQFNRLAAGSTVRNLNIDLVRSVKVSLPPLSVQRNIASRLDNLAQAAAEAKACYAAKVTALAELKQSIFARAFSGDPIREPIAA